MDLAELYKIQTECSERIPNSPSKTANSKFTPRINEPDLISRDLNIFFPTLSFLCKTDLFDQKIQ